jgi:hypothetical protein
VPAAATIGPVRPRLRAYLRAGWAEARSAGPLNLLFGGVLLVLVGFGTYQVVEGIDTIRAMGPNGIPGTTTIGTCTAGRGGYSCDGTFVSTDRRVVINDVSVHPRVPADVPPDELPTRVSGAGAGRALWDDDGGAQIVLGVFFWLIGLLWVHWTYFTPVPSPPARGAAGGPRGRARRRRRPRPARADGPSP